jgi:DNA-3-methyladenine glycosylase
LTDCRSRSLPREFYRTDALVLSEALIGKTLVHRVNGVELAGIITETEAYMGEIDRASHAYGGRRTARTETLFLEGGHAYVYLIYGIYSCMNITANEDGVPQGTLIRAVYPIAGQEEMYRTYLEKGRRKKTPPKAFADLSPKELYALTSGPGKLCVAMSIDRSLDRRNMVLVNSGNERIAESDFFVRDDGYRAAEIVRAPRIGIDYAGEAAEYPWRFTAKEKNGVPMLEKDGCSVIF